MPEPRDPQSIIENAEQAAAAGNYAAAEQLLREAATVQEQTLGPQHPDLANTLNNLGVVCERTDNPIDAEHYFRRAYAIATAALPPDHPFVATSRKNLHDFCAARGKSPDLPPSPPALAAWLDAPATAAPAAPPRMSSQSATKESSLPAKTQDVTPIPRKGFLRPLALSALSGVALLIVILAVGRPWGTSEQTSSPPTAATAPLREAPAAAPTTSKGIPAASAEATAAKEGRPLPEEATPRVEPIAPKQPATQPAPPARTKADAVGAVPDTPARSAAMPTVVTAQLCTALTNWRCRAADSEVPPGPMIFYTKLKSTTAATIEHRWYQGDRLHRTAKLRIEANPGDGYRTYSRTTIGSERAGDWRVELRSADGTVLDEERFTVR